MRVAVLLLLAGCGRIGFDTVDGDAPADATLTLGLVAHYPLDDEFAADRFARDVSGNNRTAGCGTCPSRMAGRNGGLAAHFDGNSDHLVTPYDSGLDFATGFSLAFWVNPQVLPTVTPRSVLNRAFGSAFGNAYGIDLGLVPTVAFEFGTPATDLRSTRPPTIGTWVHLTATWDGSMKRLYVDGVLDGEQADANVTYDVHDIVIGADQDSGTIVNFFLGLIFDVRIYDRPLSPAEIAVLAQ